MGGDVAAESLTSVDRDAMMAGKKKGETSRFTFP
jgi:hypothetical protein